MSAPKARPGFYVYAIIDVSPLLTSPELIGVYLSRRTARELLAHIAPDERRDMRIRRARLQTYET